MGATAAAVGHPPGGGAGPLASELVFVLGIDPGLSRCGYGVVERLGRGRSRAVAAGVLRTDPAADVPQRLADLQGRHPVLFGGGRTLVNSMEVAAALATL